MGCDIFFSIPIMGCPIVYFLFQLWVVLSKFPSWVGYVYFLFPSWVVLYSYCIFSIPIMGCSIPIMGYIIFLLYIFFLIYSHHGLCYIPIVYFLFPSWVVLYSHWYIFYSHHGLCCISSTPIMVCIKFPSWVFYVYFLFPSWFVLHLHCTSTSSSWVVIYSYCIFLFPSWVVFIFTIPIKGYVIFPLYIFYSHNGLC